MLEYLEILEKENKNFEKNKNKYFNMIREIAKKFNAEVYIFGSYLTKNNLAGSDVDILIVIPDNIDRLKVLLELRAKIKNRKFEFHIIHKKQKDLYLRLINSYKKLL